MTRQQIIEETVDILERIPLEKLEEIRNLLNEYYARREEEIFERGFKKLSSESHSYDFLEEEDEIYTVNDLIRR